MLTFLKLLWRRAWEWSHTQRHLLHTDSKNMDLKDKFLRRILLFTLGLMDPYYRHHFKKIGRSLSVAVPRTYVTDCNVLFSIGTLGPGGAERQLCLTVHGLTRNGVDGLEVMCASLNSDTDCFYIPFLKKAGGIKVDQFCGDSEATDTTIQQYVDVFLNAPDGLRGSTHFLREILKRKPRVAHFWMDQCNILGGIAAVAAGTSRVVLSMRSLSPEHFPLHLSYMREGYRWLAKQPSVVMINNSRAGARSYERWLGLPSNTIGVIYNAVNICDEDVNRYRKTKLAFRRQWGIPDEAMLLGTVMRMSEEKRPLLWVDTAARAKLKDPSLHFLIVGDGPLREDILDHLKETRLADSVTMLPHQNEVFASMAAMDMFLLTSRAEGMPNVLIEAQALGVPVITTNVGGAAETVKHGETGWVLEEDDPSYIADIVVRLLNDRQFRMEASANAQIHARHKFSMERMTQDILAVYDF